MFVSAFQFVIRVPVCFYVQIVSKYTAAWKEKIKKYMNIVCRVSCRQINGIFVAFISAYIPQAICVCKQHYRHVWIQQQPKHVASVDFDLFFVAGKF